MFRETETKRTVTDKEMMPCHQCGKEPPIEVQVYPTWRGSVVFAKVECCAYKTKSERHRDTTVIKAVADLWNNKMLGLAENEVLHSATSWVHARLPEADNKLESAVRKYETAKLTMRRLKGR